MRSEIYPSYPAPDFAHLERVLTALTNISTSFQIDMVDGEFASPTSWPYTAYDFETALEKLQTWKEFYTFEFDLMVAQPQELFPQLQAFETQKVVIHYVDYDTTANVLTAADKYNLLPSVAFTNDVPIKQIDDCVTSLPISGVQLMGIATVGQQGQPFDKRTLARVRSLRINHPELDIAVDGAVNGDTLPLLYAAGANRFAPGSAITQADDPGQAYKQLLALLR